MKFNYNAHFEVSASEVKDLVIGLAKGFIKVQEWKAGLDEKEVKKSVDSMIKPKIVRRYNKTSKHDMDDFNKRHAKNLKGIRNLVDDIDKKTEYINIKCNNKSDDIDINSLPEDVKRQIALDYLRKHPLPEDKQKKIADEYIRKYGVIK